MTQRNEKISNLVKELAATFLGRENNRTSLITVTSCTTSPDMKNGTIFITVLPESKEHDALEFTKEKSRIERLFKENMKTKIIPFINIEIDRGEKNRQKLTNY